MNKIYLTTPIYYVNDIPHIGHAYCSLATDTLARFWRKKLGKKNVFFLTGVDENSQKTVEAAKKNNKEIYVYLEDMSQVWKKTWEELNISFDDFIRTTEKRHINTVNKILQKIYDAGDIYKSKYKGKYCSGCEKFLKDSELDENGLCPEHLKKPEILEEENYFFRLSKYEDVLLDFFEKYPDFLLPEKRKKEVLNFIKSGLEDISISRENAKFGIDFPFDKNHKIYVWFEALINYLSALGEDKKNVWQNTHHIIGKEITKFHCVIWPAMLFSAKIDLPRSVFAHGFFTINGIKMSKTLGNVISPLVLAKKFGNDALRLGILSSFEFGNDGDFSIDNFTNFYRTKLAGGIGNLFNRVVTLLHKFFNGDKILFISNKEENKKFKNQSLANFDKLLEEKKIKAAIDFFLKIQDDANKLLNETEVWRLAKTNLEESKKIFEKLLIYLELITEISEIFLPESFPEMKKIIGDEKKVGETKILYKN